MAGTAKTRRKWHPDIVRERIQAGQLITRLSNHVAGKVDMTSSQVRAAEILLRKSVPDLQSVTISGDADSPLTITIRDLTKRA